MKVLSILSVAAIAAMAACGSDTPKPPTFTQPAGTAAVNFSVDDTANKVYADSTLPDGGVGPSDLQWKGAMLYDPKTNKVTADSSWGGPFAALYDDGPWDKGGHEPKGATAGDHIFGVSVFVTPPASAAATYEYGLNDNYYASHGGDGWSWPPGPNGSFSVPAGATADIKADGLSLKKFGTTDFQIVVDTNALASGTWDTSVVQIKGGAWAWTNTTLKDDGAKGDAAAGDHKFTFQLSQYVPPTSQTFPHTGLPNAGDKPEFIVVFGAGAGKEYKTGGNNALVQGITAGTKASGASSFTAATVKVHCNAGSDTATNCTDTAAGGKGNSYVEIP